MRRKLFLVAVTLFSLMLAFSVGITAHAAGPSASFTLSCGSITGTATNQLGTTVYAISVIDITHQSIVLNETTVTNNFSFTFTGVNPGDSLTVLVSDGAFGTVYPLLSCGSSVGSGGASGGTSGTSGATSSGTLSVRTIVCNTPMYDSPGGGAVGSTAITSGQTWTVASGGQTDSKGQSWLQLFIAGSASGWVPASCVQ